MDLDTPFVFSCHPGVPCFNQCCSDVNIFLTPYDVLRMKNRLGISSTEFMGRYTALPIDKNQRFPVILFRMQEDETKKCHFVDEEKGCTIYEDRPWSCRMYPLGLASPKDGPKDGSKNVPKNVPKNVEVPVEQEFYFLMKEDICLGHQEKKEYTVREWIENQGVSKYDEFGRFFKEVTLHDFFEKGGQLKPEQLGMFFTALYDLDRFRKFVFDSTFLDRFQVEKKTADAIQKDDEALLRFSFQWLKFCLFGEKTMEVIDREPKGKKADGDSGRGKP